MRYLLLAIVVAAFTGLLGCASQPTTPNSLTGPARDDINDIRPPHETIYQEADDF